MVRFTVPGMTCGGCARSILNAILGIDAQARVETDIPARQVSIASRANRATLVAAMREAGYEAEAA
jgi:copper chaperone